MISKIPLNLLDQFTCNGQIIVRDWFFDDSNKIMDCHYTSENIDNLISLAKKNVSISYERTDPFLYGALSKYPIKDKLLLVVGSEKPAYESLCLANDAYPIVVEYRKIFCTRTDIVYLTEKEYQENPIICDAAFSISSFEHSGLGRYGDPIDPNGDLKSMKVLKQRVQKNGLLYLAVPVGVDCVYFNAMRVYGKVRFPMLIDGWELVDSFGFELDMFNKDPLGKDYKQPVFVLKNS